MSHVWAGRWQNGHFCCVSMLRMAHWSHMTWPQTRATFVVDWSVQIVHSRSRFPRPGEFSRTAETPYFSFAFCAIIAITPLNNEVSFWSYIGTSTTSTRKRLFCLYKFIAWLCETKKTNLRQFLVKNRTKYSSGLLKLFYSNHTRTQKLAWQKW